MSRCIRAAGAAAVLTILSSGTPRLSAQGVQDVYMSLSGHFLGQIRGDATRPDRANQFEVYALTTTGSPGKGTMTINATIGLDAAPVLIDALNRMDVLTVRFDFERVDRAGQLKPLASLKGVNAQLLSYALGGIPGHPYVATISFSAPMTAMIDSAGQPSAGPVPTKSLASAADRSPILRGDQIKLLRGGTVDDATNRGATPGVALDSIHFQVTHPVGSGKSVVSLLRFATHDDVALSSLRRAQAGGDSLVNTSLRWYTPDPSGVERARLAVTIARAGFRRPDGSSGAGAGDATSTATSFDAFLTPSASPSTHMLTISNVKYNKATGEAIDPMSVVLY